MLEMARRRPKAPTNRVVHLGVAQDGPKDRDEELRGLLFGWQNGRCAICGRSMHRSTRAGDMIRRLFADHDHQTGLLRGYLCWGCNLAEGRQTTRAYRYVGYRLRHPATILGLSITYISPFAVRRRDSPEGTVCELAATLRPMIRSMTDSRALGLEIPTAALDELLAIFAKNDPDRFRVASL